MTSAMDASSRRHVERANSQHSIVSGYIPPPDEFLPFRTSSIAADAVIDKIVEHVNEEILIKEIQHKLPDYNIEAVCQISYQVSLLKQTHYDLRIDDNYLDPDEEPTIPKRDSYHTDTVDVRPNPIVELNPNILLDTLATPSELARSFGRRNRQNLV